MFICLSQVSKWDSLQPNLVRITSRIGPEFLPFAVDVFYPSERFAIDWAIGQNGGFSKTFFFMKSKEFRSYGMNNFLFWVWIIFSNWKIYNRLSHVSKWRFFLIFSMKSKELRSYGKKNVVIYSRGIFSNRNICNRLSHVSKWRFSKWISWEKSENGGGSPGAPSVQGHRRWQCPRLALVVISQLNSICYWRHKVAKWSFNDVFWWTLMMRPLIRLVSSGVIAIGSRHFRVICRIPTDNNRQRSHVGWEQHHRIIKSTDCNQSTQSRT